jgi:hypothetical protein
VIPSPEPDDWAGPVRLQGPLAAHPMLRRLQALKQGLGCATSDSGLKDQRLLFPRYLQSRSPAILTLEERGSLEPRMRAGAAPFPVQPLWTHARRPSSSKSGICANRLWLPNRTAHKRSQRSASNRQRNFRSAFRTPPIARPIGDFTVPPMALPTVLFGLCSGPLLNC